MGTYGLPQELWINVFSDLDYATLKSLKTVCKLFNRLVSSTAPEKKNRHSAIDVALFRDWPRDDEQKTKEADQYELHPFLLQCGAELDGRKCNRRHNHSQSSACCDHNLMVTKRFLYYDEIQKFGELLIAHGKRMRASKKFYNLNLLENATSPASGYLIFNFQFDGRSSDLNPITLNGGVKMSCRRGISVMDMMHIWGMRVYQFWAMVILNMPSPWWRTFGRSVRADFEAMKAGMPGKIRDSYHHVLEGVEQSIVRVE